MSVMLVIWRMAARWAMLTRVEQGMARVGRGGDMESVCRVMQWITTLKSCLPVNAGMALSTQSKYDW